MIRAFVIAAAVLMMAVPPVEAGPRPEHAADPQFIKAQIKDILSQPEYNRSFERRQTLGERISAWAQSMLPRFIRWLLDPLGLEGGVGRVASMALAWTVIVVFVVLFVLAAVRFTSRCRGGRAAEAEGQWDRAMPSSPRLMNEAAELARSGDYRGAFLKAYLALIVYLDEIEALRIQRGRTNWEYLRDLQGRGHAVYAEEMIGVTHSFDRKFYGGEPSTRDDYEAAREVLDAIKQRAG